MPRITQSTVRVIYQKILVVFPDTIIDAGDVEDYLNICEQEEIQWFGRKAEDLQQDIIQMFGLDSANETN